MKINKLGFLSLFALFGILGLIINKRSLAGLLGFAYYFRYFFVTPDEMFIQNVQRAASIGFFSGVAATAAAIVVRVLFPSIITGSAALASCYIVSLFCFTIALTVFEIKEQQGA